MKTIGTACAAVMQPSEYDRPMAAPNTATKVVAYFSAEFLTGPHLGNSPIALGIRDAAQQALSRAGQDR